MAALAGAAWLSAVIHSFWLLAHLSGKNSVWQMVIHGIRWFDDENFTPRGLVLRRRCLLSAAVFFASALALLVLTSSTGSRN